MMMRLQIFLLQGQEYIVWDLAEGPLPGIGGISLLLDRRRGIGGDQLLLVQEGMALRAFTGDGRETLVQAAACFVAACWCGRRGRETEAAALLHRLDVAGRRQLGVSSLQRAELHLTDCFCRQLMDADEVRLAAVI